MKRLSPEKIDKLRNAIKKLSPEAIDWMRSQQQSWEEFYNIRRTDEELFKLIEIHKVIAGVPWVLERIHKAAHEGDIEFLVNFGKHLAAKPPYERGNVKLREFLVVNWGRCSNPLSHVNTQTILNELKTKKIVGRSYQKKTLDRLIERMHLPRFRHGKPLKESDRD